MTHKDESMRREADPTLVDDDRPFWHKAEIWYFALPVLLASVFILGIGLASGAGWTIVIAWGALVLVTVVAIPIWGWYLEPTPVDHGPGEEQEPQDEDPAQETTA